VEHDAFLVFANAVLVLHVAIVLFVIGGLLLIVLGNLCRPRWDWVNAWWFRLAHLVAIGIVVAETWFGITCPLTTLEAALRVRAGAPVHGGEGFIEHWLQRLLYYDAPAWVFTLIYTLFALMVVLAWWRFPPRRGGD
jgi:hypothetical protein